MPETLLTGATVLAVLAVLDVVWLAVVALAFYRKHLGSMLREKPRLTVAALFYVLHAVGITILAVQPALARGDALHAALLGAFLGGCAYGAYEITNFATLRHWPLRLVVVDIAWGVILTASASVAGFLAGQLT